MAIREEELISESYKKRPRDFWMWLVLLLAFFLGIFGIQWGLKEALEERICESPFGRVTNREMAVFVWQNPEFMRGNQKRKQGYLPAFQYLDKIGLEPEFDAAWAVAPPEVLFAYHTWSRILGEVWILTPVSPGEFRDFLEYAEEWKPENWEDAPRDYVKLVRNLDQETGDLGPQLPQTVRLSFQGWQDYFQNGEAIQAMAPTYEELGEFLAAYPEYSRPLWKNLVGEQYLQSQGTGYVPQDELTGFLKAALFRTSRQSNR